MRIAAERGDLDKVTKYLTQGADVNSQDGVSQ